MVVPKDQITTKLIVTCLNEEGNVQEFIGELMTYLPSTINLVIVLINNGSTDRTGLIIDSLSQKYPCITAIHRKKTLNYSESILEANQYPFGFDVDYIGWAPSDNQITGKDVVRTLKALIKSRPVFIKVYRYEKDYSLWRKVQSYCFNIIISILFNQNIKDINGSPKFFRVDLFPYLDLKADKWFLDGEVYLKVSRLVKKTEIFSIPVKFNERTHGKTKTSWFTAFELFIQVIWFRLWGMYKWLKHLEVENSYRNATRDKNIGN